MRIMASQRLARLRLPPTHVVLIVAVVSVMHMMLGRPYLKSYRSPLSTVSSPALKRPRHGPRTIDFKPFSLPPELHNTTVLGEFLPGLVYNERFFWIGARLSTSFSTNEGYVDVFGFPGDWFTRILNKRPVCTADKNTSYNFLHYGEMAQEVKLFCQVECTDGDPCGEAIEMELIPLVSGDGNQQDTTLIWRCNVTQHITKQQLQEAALQDPRQAIRTHFWVQETMRIRKTHYLANVTTIDIPLSTGVAGHAGPQIRSSKQGYLAETMMPTKQIGICIHTYGMQAQKYLPEFVQHHKNAGFEQIVIGVETTLGSDEMNSAQKLLAPYIDEGFVMLAATGLKSYFDCRKKFQQLHFYHQCLYHFKGIAKYSARWDVDEYWIPPKQLEVTGLHRQKPYISRGRAPNRTHSFSEDAIKLITKSEPSAYLPLVTDDPLWRRSLYAESVSIQDVMSAIDRYHIHSGCGGAWCYHLFPSFTVYRKGNATSWRTHQLVDDFYRRDKYTNPTWQKGVANTQVAMMGGIHLAGSCRAEGDKTYHRYSTDQKNCFPHRFESDVYGSMHHFFSLFKYRDHKPKTDSKESPLDFPVDEYVTQYGKTVSKQLDVLYGKSFAAKQGTAKGTFKSR